MKKKLYLFISTMLIWAVSSISCWLTVNLFNLTSTNQFTGKMKSFELELFNSFKANFVIIFSVFIIFYIKNIIIKIINDK